MRASIIYEGKVLDNLPDLEVNDKGMEIIFHIIQENGSALDLTGMTMKFKAKKLNDFDEYLINKEGTLTDETAGYCKVEIEDADLSEAGTFEASIELTKTDYKSSITLGYFNVREDN